MPANALVPIGIGILAALAGFSGQGRDGPVPPWVEGTRCARVLEDGTIGTPSDMLSTLCGSGDLRVSCDFTNAEPLDIYASQACGPAQLLVVPARTMLIDGAWDDKAWLQWLTIDSTGQATVLATRALSQLGGVIRVARQPDRFLRVLRQGFSPATISVADLELTRRWSVPRPTPGSELILWVPDSLVRPVTVRVEGPWNGIVEVRERSLSSEHGLPSGEYKVSPVYEGGLVGQPQRVVLSSGHSALIVLPVERVGAARVKGTTELCSGASEIRVIGRGSAPERTVARYAGLERDCSLSIAGLKPGSYELRWLAGNAVVGVQGFVIRDQTVVTLDLTDSVEVGGRVHMNGLPAPGIELQFVPAAGEAVQPLTTLTDMEGTYALTVPVPGPYHVLFRKDRLVLFGQEREVSLKRGLNAIDWSLTGGSITLQVTGWEPPSPVTVDFRRIAPKRPGVFSHGVLIESPAELPYTVEGLGLGRYELWATQRGDAAGNMDRLSERVVVDLTRDQSTATVLLRLDDRRDGMLTVRDDVGRPIEDATAVGPEGRLPRVAPGVFRIETWAAGAHVTITSPRHTPVCTRMPTYGGKDMILSTGQQTRVLFNGIGDLRAPVGRFIWAGTECPIEANAFAFVPEPSSSPDSTKFLFLNFPSSVDVHHLLRPFDNRAEPARAAADGTVEVAIFDR